MRVPTLFKNSKVDFLFNRFFFPPRFMEELKTELPRLTGEKGRTSRKGLSCFSLGSP